MSQQMLQAGIALQIGTKFAGFINDFLQVIYTGAVITAAKIQGRNFVVEHHDPVLIKKNSILFQFFFNIRHQLQPFFECSQHKMLVNLGSAYINESLYTKVIMILNSTGLRKSFKFFKGYCKRFVITKIKMSVQQIM